MSRFLVIAPLLAVLASATGCASVENRFLYHPACCSKENYEQPPLPLQDMDLTIFDGTHIHARWCPHPGAHGAVLYCHGNAGNVDRRAGVVRQLWETLGESVLIFDYPGYGYSEGKPSEPGCYAAADAAYDWLTRVRKIPPKKITLYGESLGGGVAVDLASRRVHRALILVRTFTSATDVAQAHFPLLPARLVMSNRFDNLEKIGHCLRPIFIAQGDKDRLVPYSHGEKLRAACKAPVEFFTLKGLDHNDPLPADFHVALRHFVETQAPAAEAAGGPPSYSSR